MKTNVKFLFIICFMVFSLAIFAEENRWSLDIETGLVIVSRNTIQVPNPGGTRFSLHNDFDINSKLYYRIRLSSQLGKRHQLSALFAPLTIRAKGAPDEDLNFQNSIYSAGERVDALYRFNSYRLTYRYLLLNKKKLKLWLGFTAKIRDAKILLSSKSQEDDTTNVGFVPLLNLVLDWGFGERIGVLFEVDALAAPGGQGRAEDVSLFFYHRLGKRMRLWMGYRFIEGGANVEEVYNFAFLNYVYGGIQLTF